MSFSLRDRLKGQQRPELTEQERLDRALTTARHRLVAGGVFLGLLFTGIAGGLVKASIMSPDETVATAERRTAPKMVTARAEIVDRNGMVLATNLPTRSLFADARDVQNPEEAADKLRTVLPELDRDWLIDRLSSERAFIWIRRHLSPDQQYAVNRLGLPGLNFQRTERRFYPQSRLTAHALGFTDVDNQGIAGLERQFDAQLRSGTQLQVALDTRVQAVMRTELRTAMAEFSAIGAAGVLMDIRSGEVLSLTSLPDFDPHRPGQSPTEAGFNRASLGVYELGSIFKLITAAVALDTGVASMNSVYDATKPLIVARHRIRDFHAENRWLSLPEVLVFSSNIGSARMALSFGTKTQQDYLRRLGMFDVTSLELPERGRPLKPGTWREVNTMTIAFGHGLSVTPVHLAAGVGTVANGGFKLTPTLLKVDQAVQGERIFSERTSQNMRKLMRLVVTEGSGKKAEVPGYFLGGKTGTAEKLVNGRYDGGKRMSSFAAAFPMHDPQYVLLISLDEPKGTKETFGYATAGWVAAPAAGNIIRRVAPMLGVDPAEATDVRVTRALDLNFKKGERKLASF